jgi:hypothetical protein
MNVNQVVPPKAPELNGGLYTGEPFRGPWGNVPVIPDATVLTGMAALPQARTQMPPDSFRPGNNSPLPPQSMPHPLSDSHKQTLCTQHSVSASTVVRSFDGVTPFGAW